MPTDDRGGGGGGASEGKSYMLGYLQRLLDRNSSQVHGAVNPLGSNWAAAYGYRPAPWQRKASLEPAAISWIANSLAENYYKPSAGGIDYGGGRGLGAWNPLGTKTPTSTKPVPTGTPIPPPTTPPPGSGGAVPPGVPPGGSPTLPPDWGGNIINEAENPNAPPPYYGDGTGSSAPPGGSTIDPALVKPYPGGLSQRELDIIQSTISANPPPGTDMEDYNRRVAERDANLDIWTQAFIAGQQLPGRTPEQQAEAEAIRRLLYGGNEQVEATPEITLQKMLVRRV